MNKVIKFNEWAPLYSIERSDLDEVTVFGAVAFYLQSETDSQLVHQVGSDPLIFGRSLMKPFQMKVFAADLKDDLSDQQKAVAVASHAGQDIHLSMVHSMGTDLIRPLIKLAADHTCTGKHTALLRGCAKRGWPLENYLSAEHPYHQAYLKVLRRYLGAHWQPQVTAIDGCGLPTLSKKVSELAELYAKLAFYSEEDWIFKSMTQNPDYVGGVGRLDTNIMNIGRGQIVAKEGADGLLGLSLQLPPRAGSKSRSLGVVIKIAQGYDLSALAILAAEVLRPFGYELPVSRLYQLRPIVPRAVLEYDQQR
jgi:L-asparaginase